MLEIDAARGPASRAAAYPRAAMQTDDRRRLALWIATACIVSLAALSLLAPFAPLFDPFAWLSWGREVAHLDLDTSAGPSWKPLPVIASAVLSLTGDAAPQLWLLVVRVAWLASLVLAWRLAARLMFPDRVATALALRFAPRRVRLARNLAGAAAVLGLILLFDPFTAWMRQVVGGLSEPLLVALVLGAIDRELSRRPGQALALAASAALLRPESWPLLVCYGVWIWRHDPALRRWLVAIAIAVPVLWIVPDLLGSGSALTGSERARDVNGSFFGEAGEAVARAFNLPLAALWIGVVIAVASARRHAETAIVVLAAGALAWIAIVAVLAGAGYAGIPRFASPAAAVACVLGGVGIVRLLAAIDGMRAIDRRRRHAIVLATILLTGFAVQSAFRAADIPGVLDDSVEYGRHIEGFEDLADALGPERLAGCGRVTNTEFLSQTAIAWKLDLPISKIHILVATAPTSGIAFVSPGATLLAVTAIERAGDLQGTHAGWSAYAISCGDTGASGASGPAIAGVLGASRYGLSATSSSSR
jgi:hypothetical protein